MDRHAKARRLLELLTGFKEGQIITAGYGCFRIAVIYFDRERGGQSRIMAGLEVIAGYAECESGHRFYESLGMVTRSGKTLAKKYRRIT